MLSFRLFLGDSLEDQLPLWRQVRFCFAPGFGGRRHRNVPGGPWSCFGEADLTCREMSPQRRNVDFSGIKDQLDARLGSMHICQST